MGTQNHEKWRFYTPKIWVITMKNEGFGFPWYGVFTQHVPVKRTQEECRVLVPHESGKEQVNTDLRGWQELPNLKKCQRSAAYTYHIQKNIHNIVINTNKQTRI